MPEESLLYLCGKPLLLLVVVHAASGIHEDRRVCIRMPQQVLRLLRVVLMGLNQELAVSDAFLDSGLRVLGKLVREDRPFWRGVSPYQPFGLHAMRGESAFQHAVVEIFDVDCDGSDGRDHCRGWLNHEAR